MMNKYIPNRHIFTTAVSPFTVILNFIKNNQELLDRTENVGNIFFRLLVKERLFIMTVQCFIDWLCYLGVYVTVFSILCSYKNTDDKTQM